MLKHTDYEVTFAEVPDEISLCINISNCPCHCKGCHSPYLAEDIGTILTFNKLDDMIKDNKGITCVCIMGGDSEPWYVKQKMSCIRDYYPNLKTAWYSGRDTLPTVIKDNLKYFDYIKLGPYIEEKGPLNSLNTNQRFYKVENNNLIDLTYKFWK